MRGYYRHIFHFELRIGMTRGFLKHRSAGFPLTFNEFRKLKRKHIGFLLICRVGFSYIFHMYPAIFFSFLPLFIHLPLPNFFQYLLVSTLSIPYDRISGFGICVRIPMHVLQDLFPQLHKPRSVQCEQISDLRLFEWRFHKTKEEGMKFAPLEALCQRIGPLL